MLSERSCKSILKKAKALAVIGGDRMIKRLGKASSSKKGEKDLVTEVDLWIEQMYKKELKKAFPDFGFLAEEENFTRPEEEYYWVIDPIDGTNNYAHGYPVFCTSIALTRKGRPVLGIVYDPLRQEMFWADKERAFLNKTPIRVSSIKTLSDALVCTGFAYKIRHTQHTNIEHFINFLYQAQGVRRDGSAAIDICYVACGRLDGFWELNLKSWDTAASVYILKKAGGRISDFRGNRFDIFKPEIVASNGRIHRQMLAVLDDPEEENDCLCCAPQR